MTQGSARGFYRSSAAKLRLGRRPDGRRLNAVATAAQSYVRGKNTPARARVRALWRRRHADRDQRRIRRVCFDAAGHLPFADKGRRIARRTAIGAHQHFVAAARRRAAADQAVQPNDAQGRTGRSLLALRARGRAARPGPTGPAGAGIAFRARAVPCGSGSPFGPLPQPASPSTNSPDEQQISRPAFFSTCRLGGAPDAPH